MFSDKSIIYIDQHVVVLNKPSGVTTVPAKRKDVVSAEEWLIDHIKETNDYPPKFIAACNRLDRDTSGLVVFALRKSVASKINEQFGENFKQLNEKSRINKKSDFFFFKYLEILPIFNL